MSETEIEDRGVVAEYLDGYEYRAECSGSHNPNTWERILLEDFGNGLLAHIETVEANAVKAISWDMLSEKNDMLATQAAQIESLRKALKLCEEELSVILHASSTRCGDPDWECPMQDAHKPNDSFQIALQAARSALAAVGEKKSPATKEQG